VKIAILGFGIEGHSAYEYWNKEDNEITICDRDESIEIPSDGHSKLGPTYLSDLDQFDLIVRSPSLYPGDIVKANSSSILDKVTTSTNDFFKMSPSKNIIGVTGTKGKGTTSTLIANLLKASGRRVHLGGNIGSSAIDLLKNQIQPDDWIVLELSSFQLIDLKYSPVIAVCLMIAPEHLNWHLDMDEYINAKSNIFKYQMISDTAIYFADNSYSKKLAEKSPGRKIPYFAKPGAVVDDDNFVIDDQVICKTSEIKLIGKHNWQNICAALTAYWQVDQNQTVARDVMIGFNGLEHRLELFSAKNGIRYYNDSFASVPDATMAAIESIPGQKVMIIGGFDRGLDLSNLANSIKQHEIEVERVILIGASAQRTAEALERANFFNFQICNAKTMKDIVQLANETAKSSGSIVLSPGFPSFDMFKNFEDRGKQFKEVVNDL